MTTISASVGIVTGDPDELLAFYADAFGFVVESSSEFPQGAVHRLRAGDAHLKLYAPADGAATPDPPEPWFRDRGMAYAALHVADAAGLADAVRDAGGVVLTEPVSHRPGAVYALVRDPQGNVWELLQES